MRFYLGTHVLSFLEKTDVPLFISRPTLAETVNPPRAHGPWALDSGGFTQIFTYGHWTITPEEFAEQTRFWRRQVGNLDWTAGQDFMCEPHILLRAMVYEGLLPGIRDTGDIKTMKAIQARYGKLGEKFKDKSLIMERVCVHQQRTIDNLIRLREIAPDVHWMPVLQGWTAEDYIAHAKAWLRAGIDLTKEPIVGLGSVCRREKLDVAEAVISTLTGGDWRLNLHGFGLKNDAFENQVIARGLASADSLAWSYMARYGTDMVDDPDREGKKLKKKLCRVKHPSGEEYSKSGCTNCLYWALDWRKHALKKWEETVLEKPTAKRRRRTANPPSEEYVLLPPGEARQIGPEVGEVVTSDGEPIINGIHDGIARFVSTTYPGSTRYVFYQGDRPVSGLHIMSHDGVNGVIAWVYTLPEWRRRGAATALLEIAREDFESVSHSEHLTDDGKAWRGSVGNPGDEGYREQQRRAQITGEPVEEYKLAHERWRRGEGDFPPPLSMNVIDGHGGFTALTRHARGSWPHCPECGGEQHSQGREVVDAATGRKCQRDEYHRADYVFDRRDTLWRPGWVLKKGTIGRIVAVRNTFYQTNNNAVEAAYRVPGYGYLVAIWFDRTTGERLDSPRRRENPPSQIDDDLTNIILMNVRPGRNVVSPIGRAGYFIVSADQSGICAVRHSTGKKVCVSTKRAVEVAKRILSGEQIPVREIDFTVAKETLIYFALTGIIEKFGRTFRRDTDWTPEDLRDRFGVDLWNRVVAWTKENKRQNPAFGDCFGFAFSEVTQNGGTLVHGVVTDPWDGKRISHAWVERDGLVLDHQTKLRGGDPLTIERFYSIWKPRDLVEYTDEQAAINATRAGHMGPWQNPGLRQPTKLFTVVPVDGIDNGLGPHVILWADPEDAALTDTDFTTEVALVSVMVDELDEGALHPHAQDLQAVIDDEPEVAGEVDASDLSWVESLSMCSQCIYDGVIPSELVTVEAQWMPGDGDTRRNYDYVQEASQPLSDDFDRASAIANQVFSESVGKYVETSILVCVSLSGEYKNRVLEFKRPVRVLIIDQNCDDITFYGDVSYAVSQRELMVEWPVQLDEVVTPEDLVDASAASDLERYQVGVAELELKVIHKLLPSGKSVTRIVGAPL